MTKLVDVLNLEWTSFPSRDREAASLVCNYLKHMGATVECRSMELLNKSGVFLLLRVVGF